MANAILEQLFIYPVKSLKGVALCQAISSMSGLQGDRQWGIIDSEGRLLTQRKYPKLACVDALIAKNGLTLRAPHAGSIAIEAPAQDEPAIDITVWKDACIGQSAGKEVNQWLNETLGSKHGLRLVKLIPSAERRFAQPERFNIKAQFLSDAAPFLIVNLDSLEALNAHLLTQNRPQVDIRHFRANVVISGIGAFAEHKYTHMSEATKRYSFDLVDHCQRCSMITVDPREGIFLPKATPFASLAELNVMPNNPKAPAFGVNSKLINGDLATLEVGHRLILS